MPKFARRPDTLREAQHDLLAGVGVSPVRRSILIDLAEVGVFEAADPLTRSALAEQFGLSVGELDVVVDQLEEIAERSYSSRQREPVDAMAAESDLELAEEGLSTFVTRHRFAGSADEEALIGTDPTP